VNQNSPMKMGELRTRPNATDDKEATMIRFIYQSYISIAVLIFAIVLQGGVPMNPSIFEHEVDANGIATADGMRQLANDVAGTYEYCLDAKAAGDAVKAARFAHSLRCDTGGLLQAEALALGEVQAGGAK